MNRRDFLHRMALAGLAVATPKLIFDMGANSYRNQPYWIANGVSWEDPFGRIGYLVFNDGGKIGPGLKEDLINRPKLSMMDIQTYYNYYKTLPGAIEL